MSISQNAELNLNGDWAVKLKENPEIALEIENKIREKYNLPLAELAKNQGNEAKAETIADKASADGKVEKE